MPRGGVRPGAGRPRKIIDPAAGPRIVRTLDQLLKFRCRKYGITTEQYFKLYEHQKGCCALCGKPGSQSGLNIDNGLFIDHDHGSTQIRGLIHPRCNSMIGYAGDDIELMEKGIAYLKRTNKFYRP